MLNCTVIILGFNVVVSYKIVFLHGVLMSKDRIYVCLHTPLYILYNKVNSNKHQCYQNQLIGQRLGQDQVTIPVKCISFAADVFFEFHDSNT